MVLWDSNPPTSPSSHSGYAQLTRYPTPSGLTTEGIPSPRSFSSCRSATLWLSLLRSSSLWKTPLLFVPFIRILACNHPLVSLDTESSEIVQKTPYAILFLDPPDTHEAVYKPWLSLEVAIPESKATHCRLSSKCKINK